MGNSVIVPLGVLRPILLPSCSANQRLPSGPTVMPVGPLLALGRANSVILPPLVMRPILLLLLHAKLESRTHAVNQRAPSGPAVMPVGPLLALGRANSVICPSGAMRPI